MSIDSGKMKKALQYHVVPGAALTPKRLADLAKKSPGTAFIMTTIEGEKISAEVRNGVVVINGSPLADVAPSQGGKTLIVPITEVVVPPSLGGPQPTKLVGGKEVPIDPKASSSVGAAATAAALAVPALLAALL